MFRLLIALLLISYSVQAEQNDEEAVNLRCYEYSEYSDVPEGYPDEISTGLVTEITILEDRTVSEAFYVNNASWFGLSNVSFEPEDCSEIDENIFDCKKYEYISSKDQEIKNRMIFDLNEKSVLKTQTKNGRAAKARKITTGYDEHSGFHWKCKIKTIKSVKEKD